MLGLSFANAVQLSIPRHDFPATGTVAHVESILWCCQHCCGSPQHNNTSDLAMLPWGRFFHRGKAASHSECLVLACQADGTATKSLDQLQNTFCARRSCSRFGKTHCVCRLHPLPCLSSNSHELATSARRRVVVATQT